MDRNPKPKAMGRMADQTPRDDDRQHVSGEVERARILAAVLREQAERAEAAREVLERRTRWSRVRRGALGVAWVAMAWVWLGGHPALRMQPPPAPTVVQEAQALRLQMYLLAQRVEAFRQRSGRLPFVLAETGSTPPGLTYERLDNRDYRLEGRADRVGVRYHSRRPAGDLLGAGAGLLAPDRSAGLLVPDRGGGFMAPDGNGGFMAPDQGGAFPAPRASDGP